MSEKDEEEKQAALKNAEALNSATYKIINRLVHDSGGILRREKLETFHLGGLQHGLSFVDHVQDDIVLLRNSRDMFRLHGTSLVCKSSFVKGTKFKFPRYLKKMDETEELNLNKNVKSQIKNEFLAMGINYLLTSCDIISIYLSIYRLTINKLFVYSMRCSF